MDNDELNSRDLRQTVFAALTGQGGDVTGRPNGDLVQLLVAAYGPPTRAGSAVNSRAAAAALGVSQRTVQRWVTQGAQSRNISPDQRATITRQARQAATVRAGRRRAVAAARQGPLARQGAQLSVRASQGPRGYERLRRVDLNLSPEQVQQLFDVYEAGGAPAFTSWLEGQFDQQYVAGWNIRNIEDLGLQ